MDLLRALAGGGPMLPFGGASAPLGGPFGGLGAGINPSEPFKQTYRCYAVAVAGKENLESGDKIILPPSALDQLARRSVTYPMMFRLSPKAKAGGSGGSAAPVPHTHCGVMEFSAEEGTCYLPYWVMQNLLLENSGLVDVQNVTLRKGSYVKLQPHSVRFTQLHNPRIVLEKALRNFSCLTQGDTIAIQHGSENFYLDVKEVRPERAVSIIETDVNVDFDAPKVSPGLGVELISSTATALMSFLLTRSVLV
jgi:ubiquitin fusion degradation protein 1